MGMDRSMPFDRQQVTDRLTGDREMIRDVIRRSLATCPQQVCAIARAIDAGDPQRVRTAAHTLKKSAARLPATFVVDAAWALESLARRGDLVHAELVWLRLTIEHARLMDALRSWEIELAGDAMEVV